MATMGPTETHTAARNSGLGLTTCILSCTVTNRPMGRYAEQSGQMRLAEGKDYSPQVE